MSAVNLSFIQGLTKEYSLGDSHSALRKLLQTGREEASLYTIFV